MELTCWPARFLLEHRAFILKSRMLQSEYTMNIFYIIGVIVVVLFVAGFLGCTLEQNIWRRPRDHEFKSRILDPSTATESVAPIELARMDHPTAFQNAIGNPKA
jgi:hypothetical protein